jgi:hypothetical protein
MYYKIFNHAEFENPAVVVLKIQVFWDVMMCHWESNFQCSEGSMHVGNNGNFCPNNAVLLPKKTSIFLCFIISLFHMNLVSYI